MPAALPLSMREEIVRRHQHGETFRQIARELKVSYAATRRIWARFTQEGDLKPHYDRCPPARPIDRDDPRLAGLQSAGTDGLNPKWGGARICAHACISLKDRNICSDF